STARSGSLNTMRMMAQSAVSMIVIDTMRTSVFSKQRRTLTIAPTRLARKMLNWRMLGQSRPRAVAKSVPASSPKLMLRPLLGVPRVYGQLPPPVNRRIRLSAVDVLSWHGHHGPLLTLFLRPILVSYKCSLSAETASGLGDHLPGLALTVRGETWQTRHRTRN